MGLYKLECLDEAKRLLRGTADRKVVDAYVFDYTVRIDDEQPPTRMHKHHNHTFIRINNHLKQPDVYSLYILKLKTYILVISIFSIFLKAAHCLILFNIP